MPSHNVKFNHDWLKEKDGNDHPIKEWCEPGDSEYLANCIVCKKAVDIRNRGKNQLLSHAATKKHRTHATGLMAKNQPKLFTVTNNDGEKMVGMDLTAAAGSSTAYKMSHDDEVARAEIIWTLKVAESGLSYASCDSLKNDFHAMFPDSKIAKSFSLGADKVSYEISHGLGPFFHEEIIQKLKTSKAFYTLSFDEATNDCGNKQLDLHLRWWGNSGGIQNYYFCTYLLGHATSDIMKKQILDALSTSDLSLGQLLMISSDGPNVNKKLLKLIDEHLKEKIPRHTGLINFGSCNLHIVHNSFGRAMNEFSNWGIEEFLDAIFKYFSKYPARKEDFQGVQNLMDVEQREFKRYVNSRWLSLVPVIERILEQYDAIHHYFITVVPKQGGKTDSYYTKKIIAALNTPATTVRLHFLKSVGSLYTKFLTLMQSDQPLIHILYDELSELIRSLMSRFVKPKLIEGKSGASLCKIDLTNIDNLLPLESQKVGEETKRGISKLKQSEVSIFRHDARKFMTIVVQYLVDRVPLTSNLLRALQCLHPLMRTEKSAENSIKEVAREMPRILLLSEHDSLLQEWQLYANEDVTRESYIDDEFDSPDGHCIKWKRIDLYWESILSNVTSLGTPKYPTLGRLVKAALTLSHGQAHVERGFSLNKTLVTTRRSCLNERSINGLRTVQDKVKHEGGASKVIITPKTIRAFRSAHSKYKAMRDAEKRAEEEKQRNEEKQKEEEKRLKLKRKQEEKEADLLKRQKSQQDEIDQSKKLVSEANQRLKKACTAKKINPVEVAAAQALLECGSSKLEKSSAELKNISEQIASLNKKKSQNASQ